MPHLRVPLLALHAALSEPGLASREVVVLVWVLLPLLTVSAAWAGARALWAITPARRWPFTWRYSLRRLGPVPFVVSAVLAALLVSVDATNNMPMLTRLRAVETVVPLIAALHAAYLFSPEEEPVLELTLAAPRPLAWTVGERLALLLGGHGTIALVAGSAVAQLEGVSWTSSLVRWLAPFLLLTALSISLTLVRRQAVLSVGFILLLWFGMLWGGDAMLARWPFLWPLHIFLQPGHPHSALNRAVLVLAGLNLLALCATYLLRDEERLLLGERAAANPAVRAGHR